MCRFIAYLGSPILLSQLLYEPQNSLIHQSYKAQEREEPLNGDGFGVGWYQLDIEPTPAVFVSVWPAWNNKNLRYIAPKIRSRCIFAHVRAASMGDVTQNNCHPFHYDSLLFMHNGHLGGFDKMKRLLRHKLSDQMYNWIQGETDSEHFFALFLDNLIKSGRECNSGNVGLTLQETICDVLHMAHEVAMDGPILLNVAITNGDFIVSTRYVSDPAVNPNTLYYSEGSRYECRDGVCHMMQTSPAEHAVLIVSEKLTDVKEDWHEVPRNHLITVNEDLSAELSPIRA